ncbi:sn-glycerol-3-phosphate ABC transporter ATP-binding protein UgpC [Fulvimarina sp. 2208YS6-2-32]|uniref:Sn-glycerol-3-phosphate ABC transporter ATP-binding protein UgpC n=2 Tax=Fulvimarina uroteuthidis TaxID=3098149 RepID=A0ABU5I6P2_9HYPH|nr:sn-glycerol-3-phosphate ABC transporter ATP-binding protein UgpC [Fulvimarina sp. 2208YS6-2-32]MDY8111037.1 sn-glycerol-3-phosphate ABC transporter ATP-binding protein UgpC [Fulvimarina sp. 2208YS6-2-32]
MTGVGGRSKTAGLKLRRLHKSFGTFEVLHDISLDIEAGEFVVFVGPSGCGKSTLLRLIAGLEAASAGDVFIGGTDVTERDPSERGIAMVFQTYALYPHMTVGENMGFGLKAAKRPKAEIERKVREAADALKLTDYLDRRPGQLSGGQRQRVAIGRAIVREPDVFLFDEPLSNLDAELRVDMRIEIARLHRQLGNTMIYVTHDQTEAMTLADKIIVLRSGRIEQVGSPRALYDDPDNVFVAGFIGSPAMNILDAVVDEKGGLRIGEDRLPADPQLPPLAPGRRVKVGVRPEHLLVGSSQKEGIAMDVEFTEFLGGTSYLYGVVAGGQRLTVESRRGFVAKTGTMLRLTAEAADLRLFDENGERIR